MPRSALAIAAALAILPTAAHAADPIPGPISAHVVSVYDGDTLTVDAMPWPGVMIRTSGRVDGVDTPEIRGSCQTEKDRAIRARDFVKRVTTIAVVGALPIATDLGKALVH